MRRHRYSCARAAEAGVRVHFPPRVLASAGPEFAGNAVQGITGDVAAVTLMPAEAPGKAFLFNGKRILLSVEPFWCIDEPRRLSGICSSHSVEQNFINGECSIHSGKQILYSRRQKNHSGEQKRPSGRQERLSGKQE